MQQGFMHTLRLIKLDMQARSLQEEKPLTALRVVRFLFKSASTPIVLYRWQVFFYQHHLGVIAALLKCINNIVFTVVIDSDTEIGPGFILYHSSYIFIGSGVKLGSHCHFAGQNTIMASPYYRADAGQSARGPVIGDGLLMGVGASITGDIVLGNNVKVSVNSSVEDSFTDGAVLVGVPARNVLKSAAE